MTEKRYTTVELPKPNNWGIWYNGNYLSTYEVCHLLNEYVDAKKENERLKKERNHFERKKTEYLTEWNTCRIQNTELKNLIQEAYTNERTAIGKSVLKQLLEQI